MHSLPRALNDVLRRGLRLVYPFAVCCAELDIQSGHVALARDPQDGTPLVGTNGDFAPEVGKVGVNDSWIVSDKDLGCSHW